MFCVYILNVTALNSVRCGSGVFCSRTTGLALFATANRDLPVKVLVVLVVMVVMAEPPAQAELGARFRSGGHFCNAGCL